jgi:hypothetical protein
MKTIQDLQFELMERASFNEFDGARVVRDLREHSDLWTGAIMGRFHYSELIPLRDIAEDYWNVDELMILPDKDREDELEQLAKSWRADEIEWIGGEEACKELGSYSQQARENEKQILRIWWD